MSDIIMAIDQGTTGTTVLLLDPALNVLAKGYEEFRQIYPKPGWVEHDLNDIWASVESSVTQALKHANVKPGQIKAIGITNQRETTCAWNRNTGEPYNHAIVWQCRRTADECKRLREAQLESLYTKRTGLLLDPYLAGTKFKWLLDNVDGLRSDAESGKAAFGTIDSFMVWRLTGGVHVTDVSNASRTLLFNLETMNWDDDLLEPLTVPKKVLAEIVDSSAVYGETKGLSFLPDGIPVAGMAGDQQAALFGQACFEPGTAKCTYGTGSFVLLNIGDHVIHSRHRLLTTVGWRIGGETVYALEGSCFIAGAAVQWMRDGL
ncbi:glycerol kinase, partial [bacterium]|nr:glycerol kinase [bacterium]